MQHHHGETTKQELLALEKQYWNAIKAKDAATAASLSDETCVVVGAQGVGELDRATLAKMMKTGNYELRDYTIGDVHMLPISDDVVTMAYKVKEDLLVEGQPIQLEAYDASVWVKRNGNWVCATHTESLAGDPFGRH